MEPLVFGLSEKEEQGDSLGLSMYAANTEAPYLIFNGVPFMAETAKILNPSKTVLVADKTAGCSLADNFGAEDVKELKALYPGAPVMIYVNSYADAKAESDICCTSANAAHIAKTMPGDTVIFVPDIFFPVPEGGPPVHGAGEEGEQSPRGGEGQAPGPLCAGCGVCRTAAAAQGKGAPDSRDGVPHQGRKSQSRTAETS